MIEITPAIIAKDFAELQEKIKVVEPYVYPEPGRGINWVQLDVSDGKFTSMKSWDNPEDLKNLNTRLNLEVHLMISEPEKEIERWISSGVNPVRDSSRQQEGQVDEKYISNGVKRILIHCESTEKLIEITEKIKAAGLEMGLVLNLQTPIETLNNIQISKYPNIRVIQLMGISEIGYYGHPFSERVIPKIFSLREKYPNVKIAVDGGINAETASKAASAGADILVAGSAIFGSGDVGRAIEELKKSI